VVGKSRQGFLEGVIWIFNLRTCYLVIDDMCHICINDQFGLEEGAFIIWFKGPHGWSWESYPVLVSLYHSGYNDN